MILKYLAVISLITLSATDLLADKRAFVWTYQYQTLHSGEAELEQYTTISTPKGNHFEGNASVEHQFELEVGMTPRFDFSVYQVFGQSAGETYRYKAFKLRSRYRLGEIEGSITKPILYFEYKANQDFSEQELEFKPILGLESGRTIWAINPKISFEKTDEAKLEWGYAGAIAYKMNNRLALGVELTGNDEKQYLGPTISHGSERIWVSLGSGFLLGKAEAGQSEVQLRLLLGVGLSDSK